MESGRRAERKRVDRKEMFTRAEVTPAARKFFSLCFVTIVVLAVLVEPGQSTSASAKRETPETPSSAFNESSRRNRTDDNENEDNDDDEDSSATRRRNSRTPRSDLMCLQDHDAKAVTRTPYAWQWFLRKVIPAYTVHLVLDVGPGGSWQHICLRKMPVPLPKSRRTAATIDFARYLDRSNATVDGSQRKASSDDGAKDKSATEIAVELDGQEGQEEEEEEEEEDEEEEKDGEEEESKETDCDENADEDDGQEKADCEQSLVKRRKEFRQKVNASQDADVSLLLDAVMGLVNSNDIADLPDDPSASRREDDLAPYANNSDSSPRRSMMVVDNRKTRKRPAKPFSSTSATKERPCGEPIVVFVPVNHCTQSSVSSPPLWSSNRLAFRPCYRQSPLEWQNFGAGSGYGILGGMNAGIRSSGMSSQPFPIGESVAAYNAQSPYLVEKNPRLSWQSWSSRPRRGKARPSGNYDSRYGPQKWLEKREKARQKNANAGISFRISTQPKPSGLAVSRDQRADVAPRLSSWRGKRGKSRLSGPLSSQLQSKLPSQLQSRLPSRLQVRSQTRLPSRLESWLPSRSQSSLPSRLPARVSSRLSARLPSRIQSQLPSRGQLQLPSRVQLQIPSRVQLQLPSRLPLVLPSRVQSHLPSLLTSRLPSRGELQLPSRLPSRGELQLPSRLPSRGELQLSSRLPSLGQLQLPSRLPSLGQLQLPSRLPSHFPSSLTPRLPSHFPSSLTPRFPLRGQSQLPSRLPLPLPSRLSSRLPSQLPAQLPSRLTSKLSARLPSTLSFGFSSRLPPRFEMLQPRRPIDRIKNSLPSRVNIGRFPLIDKNAFATAYPCDRCPRPALIRNGAIPRSVLNSLRQDIIRHGWWNVQPQNVRGVERLMKVWPFYTERYFIPYYLRGNTVYPSRRPFCQTMPGSTDNSDFCPSSCRRSCCDPIKIQISVKGPVDERTKIFVRSTPGENVEIVPDLTGYPSRRSSVSSSVSEISQEDAYGENAAIDETAQRILERQKMREEEEP